MAKFKITPTTTVAELKEQFRNEVGCVLRVYQGRSEASDEATLVSLGAKEGELECRTSRTVGKFEEAFQNELNLKVKVYTKDNWVKVLDGITLAVAGQLPNGMTKAKMEEYLSYKRDEKEDTSDTVKSKTFNPDDYYFHNGLAEVEINGKYGFIDESGEIVIEPKFDYVASFHRGLARVGMNGKYGFIDESGEIVIKPKFDEVSDFDEDISLSKVRINDKYGYINKNGEFVIEPKFDDIIGFNDGLAIATIDGKYGFIDIKGDYVIKPIFDGLEPFLNGLARAKTDGKYGFIDMDGEYVINPIFDDLPYYFDGELMPAQIEIDDEYKYGFIDKSGNFIIEPIYDSAYEFCGGVAEVSLDDEYFKIDMQGNRVEE